MAAHLFRRPLVPLAAAIALTILSPSTVRADDLYADRPAPESAPPGPRSTATLTAAGMLAGAAGFTVGALVGIGSAGGDDDELAGIESAVITGSLVGAFTLPLGVHLANRRAGDGGKVLIMSIGIGVIGWTIALSTESWPMIPLTAVTQLFACVAVERNTTPIQAPPQPASFRVSTGLIDRAPALVVMGRF